jgi:hypothetical protein
LAVKLAASAKTQEAQNRCDDDDHPNQPKDIVHCLAFLCSVPLATLWTMQGSLQNPSSYRAEERDLAVERMKIG